MTRYLSDVWCGALGCGVVWWGVVWCGVVWCGVVWCGVVWCGVGWCGMVWCQQHLRCMYVCMYTNVCLIYMQVMMAAGVPRGLKVTVSICQPLEREQHNSFYSIAQ